MSKITASQWTGVAFARRLIAQAEGDGVALAWSLADHFEPVRRGQWDLITRALPASDMRALTALPTRSPVFGPRAAADVPVVFFNDRETVWPGELTRAFRVITRDAASPLRPNATSFRLAASHSNANRDHAAVFGTRFENTGLGPLTLELEAPRVRARFGRLASREALSEAVGVLNTVGGSGTAHLERMSGGRFRLTLSPGASVDLPLQRLAANLWPLPQWPPMQWGAYELGVTVASGQFADLALHEVGRFEGAQNEAAQDPWEHLAPDDALAIHKRQRHQEGRFRPVAAAPVTLDASARVTIAGYNFGQTPADHQYAYHVDHTVDLLIAGDPVLRFRGNGGFANPFIGGRKWASPGLDDRQVLEVPLHTAVKLGLVTLQSPGVYRLCVQFDDNDNMNLELSLVPPQAKASAGWTMQEPGKQGR